MKQKLKLIVFLFAFASLLFVSCKEYIRGNGVYTTENRNFDDIRKVKVSGGLDVTIIQSNTNRIEVKADANLLDYIITKQRGEWVEIKEERNVELNSKNEIQILVYTTALQNVEVLGSGNVKGANKFIGAKNVKVGVTGSGSLNLSVNAPNVEATVTGSGDIILDGEARDIVYSITGSGEIKGKNLRAENAEAKITSSGNIQVFASEKLKAKITGSGDIEYFGTASVEQKITGSGSIKKGE